MREEDARIGLAASLRNDGDLETFPGRAEDEAL
ncbi:MAG: hypothetical protein QOJ29_3692, partial [Thermoleophilaceae bacterium]|nr:hypothetical protein [Thermoleophilaceae bacterium]